MDNDIRQKKGAVAGIIGLCLNIVLGAAKLTAGIIAGSAAIIGDAVNNISDSAASIVTVTAFALSGRKADKEHPFGHGRYEYLAGLIIGVLILFVGFQFVLTGIERIIDPQRIGLDLPAVIILTISLAVKFFMGFYYRGTARKIRSDALKAAAFDSFFDVLITAVVLTGLAVGNASPLPIDGFCTIFVALVIIWGGIKVISQTSGKLLGNGADPDLEQKLYDIVLAAPTVVGAHDLVVHDYGPGKKLGTVHAELGRDLRISKAHGIIDKIEKDVRGILGVELVVHVDPINYSDPRLNRLRKLLGDAVADFCNDSVHELELNDDNKCISFELKLSDQSPQTKESIRAAAESCLTPEFSDYALTIKFEL